MWHTIPDAIAAFKRWREISLARWVQPFGTGTNSDFIFTLSRDLKGPTDFTAKLQLTFTNKGDGIQTITQTLDQGWSRLKLPRTSPDDGYTSTWSTTLNHGSFGTNAPQP